MQGLNSIKRARSEEGVYVKQIGGFDYATYQTKDIDKSIQAKNKQILCDKRLIEFYCSLDR